MAKLRDESGWGYTLMRRANGKAEAAGSNSAKRSGRRRSLEVDKAILEAALEVLAEVGYADLTAKAVIARAGVSSATLYRRWSSLQDVVSDALHALVPEQPLTIDTGALDTDIAAFVDYMGSLFAGKDLQAEAWSVDRIRANPKLSDAVRHVFVTPRKQLLVQILQRAVIRGELDRVPPIDDCWSLICGPINHRVHVRGMEFTPGYSRMVAIMLAEGLKALSR